MLKNKKWFSLLLPALLAGCADVSLTNLTPSQEPRNANGQYLVEMKMDSTQQTLRQDSVRPAVVVGFDSYPMKTQLKKINTWEGRIPISPRTNVFKYYF